MTPQLIVIFITIVEFGFQSHYHGTPKPGKFSVFEFLFNQSILQSLLWWGGFYEPLIRHFH